MDCVAIDHPRFRRAQRDVFLRRVVVECLSHRCSLILEPGSPVKLDACCQYGVDVDVGERDQILARAGEIRELLLGEAASQAWFTGEEIADADFPSGRQVRSTRHQGGCVFLAHDGRGCAIHRASIEGGWDYRGVKPHVCRLFPLTYTGDLLCLSDDYVDYSCSEVPGVPTVYRAARDTLGEVFGAELIAALDRAEVEVTASPALDPLRLPLA
jgi:Fe-S-cluster containining protein